ncbi:uncharacterized protein Gasu_31960 [Galdieria sulphuraria]|uniref:AMP-dependent synthetase/ligase domain-containing protein n=1 Tax=Galdieria sulphuraria TaxID=130081 RepID=M2XH34_GALSU|nr:uncharacterized protein Gasu_31960 [Galdieria sulphuraria]EME29367.1 hypothetical protein Gasu_31960 [Galdieria sulphuraria]|eukprot:XP_005705887.1 hypothetical protein Gasu_31960 [Galdieria sulphuraria]
MPLLQSLRQLPRAEYASKLAVISNGAHQRKLSHSDLHREIEQNAALLRLAGFTPGISVALYVEDELDYIIMFLSCVWVGVVVHPIPLNCSEEELKSIILTRNLKTILFSNKDGSQVSMMGHKIASELELHVIRVKQTINEGTKMELHELKTMSFEERHYKIEPNYLALVDQMEETFSNEIVSFTHEQICLAIHMVSSSHGPQSDDIVCLVGHPVSVHMLITNVLVALTNGCPILIARETILHPESVINQATSFGITWLAAPLPELSSLLTHPKAVNIYNQLKCVWCLSSSPFVRSQMQSLFTIRHSLSCPLFLIVGLISSLRLTFQYLVETVATIENEYEYWEIGQPFENIQVLLVNPDSRDIESEQGEMWISGDILSKDSLTDHCHLNDSILYMKTGWIVKRNHVGHLQPIETLQSYRQLEESRKLCNDIREEENQVLTMDSSEPPSTGLKATSLPIVPPTLDTLSSQLVSCPSSSIVKLPLPIHAKRDSSLHLPWKYDDDEPQYFRVGKSTFSLAEIDFLLQLIPSIDKVKSFLVNDRVHVALTLQPGTKVTATSFTKHLKQWGIIREGVIPVHYYVCRRWKSSTRESIKQYCLSMPQHKVKEASTESFLSKPGHQPTRKDDDPSKHHHSVSILSRDIA